MKTVDIFCEPFLVLEGCRACERTQWGYYPNGSDHYNEPSQCGGCLRNQAVRLTPPLWTVN